MSFLLPLFLAAQIYSPNRVTVPMRPFSSFSIRPAIAPSGGNPGSAGLLSAEDKYKLDTLSGGGIGATTNKISYSELRAISGAGAESVIRSNINTRLGNWYYDPSDVSSVDDSAMVLVTVDGKRLKRYTENYINATWFGAVPDDGLDDWAAIQRAVDWLVAYRNYGRLYIPGGTYELTHGILVRKDADSDGVSEFISFEIVGEKRAYTTSGGNGSETVLNCNDVTDFGIGIQKAKGFYIKNITFAGLNTAGFGVDEGNIDDPATVFVSPGVRNNSQSPYSALVIDPFSDNSMLTGNRYPFRTALYTEAGSSGSTDVRVEDCNILGFAVGIMNSPTGLIANGECHVYNNIWLKLCASGFANGHSQNRSVECHNIKAWGGIESVFDCQRYGGSGGGSAFIVDNLNIAGNCKYLCTSGNFGVGNHNVFMNVLAESLYAIGGNTVGQVVDNSEIEFYGAIIKLNGSTNGIHRAPVAVWCGTLRMQDSFLGYYGSADATAIYTVAGQVVTENRTGSNIINYISNGSTVSERHSNSRSSRDKYYVTHLGNDYGDILLTNGMTINRDFPNGAPVKSTYFGPDYNYYQTANSVTCIGRDLANCVDTFTVNSADYFMICPGATVFLNGMTGSAGVCLPIGSNKFIIGFASHNITTTTYAAATFIQFPRIGGKPNFYIGDITSGSNKVRNIEAEVGSEIYLSANKYFNHPAFPIGTYITAQAGDSITLSANATRSETGAFIGQEYSWRSEGYGGANQVAGGGSSYKTVWKDGDIIYNTYSRNNTSIDTSIRMWVCVKAGIPGTARAPIFKTVTQ